MNEASHLRIGIVADDLTSATDGAAPFVGKATAPLIMRSAIRAPAQTIVSIDTNSRALTAAEAAAAMAEAISALRDRLILFKTIDSTLRGHISEEIAAAFRASGRRKLVIAPAFPDASRTTVGGIQLVHGIPVSRSEYGRDPVHPACISSIAELIEPALGRPVVLTNDDLALETVSIDEADILILDADSQEALNRQVAQFTDPGNILWVGSPGLAIALAALLPTTVTSHTMADARAMRVLVVAGSANPVTYAQCDVLQEHGIPVVARLEELPNDADITCLRAPVTRHADPAALLTQLTEGAAAAILDHNRDAVIATGGETMAAILDRLGITGFTLIGELEPGFPVGRAVRKDGRPFLIAMKAGGFGSPVTLLRAAEVLAGRPFAEGGPSNVRM